MMIKAIIFDTGGVLLDYNTVWYYEYLAKKTGIPEKRVERAIVPLMTEMDIGKMTLDQMQRRAGRALGIAASDVEWVNGLSKMAKPNRKVVNLLKGLSKHYKIFIFSNDTKSRYRFLARLMYGNLKREGYVKKVFASCYIGYAKPDRRAYLYVLRRLGAKPGEVLFIDNTKANVDSAKKVGMQALLFTGYKRLAADMREFVHP